MKSVLMTWNAGLSLMVAALLPFEARSQVQTQYRENGAISNALYAQLASGATSDWSTSVNQACQSFKTKAKPLANTAAIDAKPAFSPAEGWVETNEGAMGCSSAYKVRVCTHPVSVRSDCQSWSSSSSGAAEVYTFNLETRPAYPLVVIAPPDPPLASCPFGNPIFPLEGIKRETVALGWAVGRLPLSFTYANRIPVTLPPWVAADNTMSDGRGVYGIVPPWQPEPLGPDWSFGLLRHLFIQGNKQGATLTRGNGRSLAFSGNGAGTYTSLVYGTSRLVETATGHLHIDAGEGVVEVFNAAGQLEEMRWAQGGGVTLTYSDGATPAVVAPRAGHLISAVDDRGRSTRFEYDAGGRLVKVISPDGQSLVLTPGANGNLASVRWPDLTERRYLYDSPAFSAGLSGIEDELGKRYATFGYVASGVAVSTEHAGGVGRYAVSHASAPQMAVGAVFDGSTSSMRVTFRAVPPQGTVLTEPNGSTRSLSSTTVAGRTHQTGQSQPAGSGCAASASAQTFDAQGNMVSRDDFNGTRTCYRYDLARNLEIGRTEGLAPGTNCAGLPAPAGSRTTSRRWHPDWHLTSAEAEPGRLVTLVHHGQPDPFNGNAVANCAPAAPLLPTGKPIAVLCKRVEQATTDESGAAGFSATLQSGVARREWRWTYNADGQMLTEDGPRTDVNDITTYDYYGDTTPDHTKGDLKTGTNAAGQTTQYTKYNAHGHLLESQDPNGVVTTNTYDLRQRILSTSVGGAITTNTYDAAGLLKKITRPDGSFLGQEHDDAHRLVGVYDHRGNRIEFQLDNAGNRVGEVTQDPGGHLKRQLSRSVDALGRVQQAVGRE